MYGRGKVGIAMVQYFSISIYYLIIQPYFGTKGLHRLSLDSLGINRGNNIIFFTLLVKSCLNDELLFTFKAREYADTWLFALSNLLALPSVSLLSSSSSLSSDSPSAFMHLNMRIGWPSLSTYTDHVSEKVPAQFSCSADDSIAVESLES
mmetsp:Transcript_11547/g.23695  ORF Transcript_11547/g.23695 Transcript_11547/m.23695 type:complete len:150 (+) Transcript_11547:107-556(+)